MSIKLRIATFNLENLDDKPGLKPTLAERVAVMRPQLLRLKADILCLQEVNGQERAGQPHQLLALDKLLSSTPYAEYHRLSTQTADGQRNLVILSRFPIVEHHQYMHDLAPAPLYKKVTAQPKENEAKPITWERPILHAKIQFGATMYLHVINVHLKSRIPSNVKGQKIDDYTWKTAEGWAEGSFISSMQRVGQALEVRRLIDKLFNEDSATPIVVAGDFNAESDEVAVAVIRGDIEDTGNDQLVARVMIPCERTIPESSRFSLLHLGQKCMLDHLLVSRNMLTSYVGSEIHNELLHDESIAFATDKKYPESDHAPVIAEFELQDS